MEDYKFSAGFASSVILTENEQKMLIYRFKKSGLSMKYRKNNKENEMVI